MKKDDKPLQLDQKGTDTLLALIAHRSRTKAAEALGISRNALYERIDKYQLNTFIDALPQRALEILKLGAEKAAEVMTDSLEDRKYKLQAAAEVLDRVGLTGKNTEAQQTNIAIIITRGEASAKDTT